MGLNFCNLSPYGLNLYNNLHFSLHLYISPSTALTTAIIVCHTKLVVFRSARVSFLFYLCHAIQETLHITYMMKKENLSFLKCISKEWPQRLSLIAPSCLIKMEDFFLSRLNLDIGFAPIAEY